MKSRRQDRCRRLCAAPGAKRNLEPPPLGDGQEKDGGAIPNYYLLYFVEMDLGEGCLPCFFSSSSPPPSYSFFFLLLHFFVSTLGVRVFVVFLYFCSSRLTLLREASFMSQSSTELMSWLLITFLFLRCRTVNCLSSLTFAVSSVRAPFNVET